MGGKRHSPHCLPPSDVHSLWEPTGVSLLLLHWRSERSCLFLLLQGDWQEVLFKMWLLTRYLDLDCGYLVFGVLRWPTRVNPFHLDHRWESSGLSLLLQGDDERFGQGVAAQRILDLRCSCCLSCLNKQNTWLRACFRDWRGNCTVCSLCQVKAVFFLLPLFLD